MVSGEENFDPKEHVKFSQFILKNVQVFDKIEHEYIEQKLAKEKLEKEQRLAKQKLAKQKFNFKKRSK